MEYIELGDLEKYIQPTLVEKDAKQITHQILCGLVVLHALHFVHRDLKPQNIFVIQAAPNWRIKIGDFGISKRLRPDEDTTWTTIGTADYIAPEVSIPDVLSRQDDSGRDDDSDEGRYPQPTIAVDIWSLGCILFRLFARQPPFPTQKKLRDFCRGRAPFPVEAVATQGVSEGGINFLLGLLKPRPEARFSTVTALEQPWIKAILDESFGPITTASDDQCLAYSELSHVVDANEPAAGVVQLHSKHRRRPLSPISNMSNCKTNERQQSFVESPGQVWRHDLSNRWREARNTSEMPIDSGVHVSQGGLPVCPPLAQTHPFSVKFNAPGSMSLRDGPSNNDTMEYKHNPYAKREEPKFQHFPKPTLDKNGAIKSFYCGYTIEKTTPSPTGNKPSWAYQTYRRQLYESDALRAIAMKRATRINQVVAQYKKIHSRHQEHIDRLLRDLNFAERGKRLEWVIVSINPIPGSNKKLEYEEIHVIFKRAGRPLGHLNPNNKAVSEKIENSGGHDRRSKFPSNEDQLRELDRLRARLFASQEQQS